MRHEKIRILTVKGNGEFTAGQKAPSDIIQILEEEYNAKSSLLVNQKSILKKFLYRLKILNTFLVSRIKNEVLVIQFPMYETSNLLNKMFLFSLSFANKNRTIVLLHDLDSIRGEDEALKKQELDRLNKVKYIISHNKRMTEYLEKENVKAKIYNLELFDYICDKKEGFERKNEINKNDFSVIYAGNLSEIKSPFLHQLDSNKLNFTFNLYGVGINNDLSKKLKYKGKFSPNELPDNFEGDLGLIWDGNYDESDEDKKYKLYTKYNNPHKLSCYVAAGIPVIAWKKAAIADFVEKYNIGYTISSIYDINNLDLNDYEEKQENILKLQNRARNGYFTTKVINKVLRDMEKENNKK